MDSGGISSFHPLLLDRSNFIKVLLLNKNPKTLKNCTPPKNGLLRWEVRILSRRFGPNIWKNKSGDIISIYVA